MIEWIIGAVLLVTTPAAERPERVPTLRAPRSVARSVQVVLPERERRQIFRGLIERFRQRRR